MMRGDLESGPLAVPENGKCKGVLDHIWGGSRNSGLACMAISSAAYSLMGLLVKLLAVREFPSSQIVMVRCGVVALLSGMGLRRMGHPLLGSPGVRQLVIVRAVVGFVALSTYFYSIQALPLRDATILNFTTPVFTAILAACMLGETWGLFQAAGTLCSFVGVLLVTQPELLFPGHKAEKRNESMLVGVVMAVIGSFTGALSYIIVRIVGKRGEPPLSSLRICLRGIFSSFSRSSCNFSGFQAPRMVGGAGALGSGLISLHCASFSDEGFATGSCRACYFHPVRQGCMHLRSGCGFPRREPIVTWSDGSSFDFIKCSIHFIRVFSSEKRQACNLESQDKDDGRGSYHKEDESATIGSEVLPTSSVLPCLKLPLYGLNTAASLQNEKQILEEDNKTTHRFIVMSELLAPA